MADIAMVALKTLSWCDITKKRVYMHTSIII